MSTVQNSSNVTDLFGAGATKTGKSAAEDTQNRFLHLLVAQMKNQDPLNPLDNAQVTSQMAQLSTVQGIENMKASMEALAASLGTNQMSQAANLIGRGVLVPGDTIRPSEVENVVGFELETPADKATLTISDASGAKVRTVNLGERKEGVNLVEWDGLRDDGSAAPDAAYHFKIEAVSEGKTVAASTLHLGLVNSVSQGSHGVQLNLAGKESASYADIRQIF
ncbi:MAG: flagellar hook assembly protein FlgD [Thiobacillus sp.]